MATPSFYNQYASRNIHFVESTNFDERSHFYHLAFYKGVCSSLILYLFNIVKQSLKKCSRS